MGGTTHEVIVVGAGAAGLACARTLHAAGVSALVLEADTVVGGRVRTEIHEDGFLLDRGFQVLLTSYPAVRALVDLRALGVHPFAPGALVARSGRLLTVSDPLRRPRETWRTLMSPVGTLSDKLRVGALRFDVARGTLEQLFEEPETSTAQHLVDLGFSTAMRDRFFRPLMGGVMLDPDLSTSSRMFRFVIRMFAAGDIALPAGGMGALMRALAAPLPSHTVRLGARAARVEPGLVALAQGEELRAPHVVLAVDGRTAAALRGRSASSPMRGTTSVYFETRAPVVDGPWLVLDGERIERGGHLNHVAPLSNVAPSYAPPGRALLSANVIGVPSLSDDALVDVLRGELVAWFGARAEGARALKVVRVPDALPVFVPPTSVAREAHAQDGIFEVGDHRATPSLQGALQSGIDAARAVLAVRST